MAQTQISSYNDETPVVSDWFNGNSNNLEADSAAKAALETTLSDAGNNISARVTVLAGNILKVKWFRNNLVFGTYKSKKYNQDRILTSLEYLKTNKLGISAPASLALTGTQTISGTGTSQFTATLTRADSSTANVSSQASWSSSDVTKATVSSTGLVEGVAAGTATITATYAGKSATRTVTVS